MYGLARLEARACRVLKNDEPPSQIPEFKNKYKRGNTTDLAQISHSQHKYSGA